MDYPGKVITKTQVTPTQTSASGNWTLDDQAAAIKNNNWPVALVPNPISKSLRFNSADSAYLNRTFTTPTNNKIWTWSSWIKLGSKISDGNYRAILEGFTGSPDVYNSIAINSDQIWLNQDNGSGGVLTVYTVAKLRDPSAWYHLVVQVDTTQATGTNRVKMYLNGIEQTLTFAATPSQNLNTWINSANTHRIAQRWSSTTSTTTGFDGYLAEVYFIDGQALTPSSFGMTNPQTGQWIPLKYSGTYGTNGFYLNFKDATSTTTLGYDYSGNANNWTTNNFSVTAGSGNDSLTDVPTPWFAYNTTGDVGGVIRGNYCTWNPLALGSDATLSNGNLDISYGTSGTISPTISTFGMSSGKWYWEITITAVSAPNSVLGITNVSSSSSAGVFVGNNANGWGYYAFDGTKYNNNSASAYGATYTTNDVIGFAFDADAGSITAYKNGVSQGVMFSSLAAGTYYPAISDGSTPQTFSASTNFGQRPFAYTPPTGFRSLCTTNLPATAIGFGLTNQGDDYFNAVLYTGDGIAIGSGGQTITGVGFQSDFTWIKCRSNAFSHRLIDAVRGAPLELISESTAAETNRTEGLNNWTSDGFVVGNASGYNANTDTFVAWNWKASGSTVSNTAGTITSTVSANTTSGFSVVTYTGNNTASTVGHGLGVAPSMYIVKLRSTTGAWGVYHSSLTAGQVLYLNLTDAVDSSAIWNSTAPTSTVFSVGAHPTSNPSGQTLVAYCFAAVAGYSAFGSYTGNGSADGPFVFCGFEPRFVLVKCSSSTGEFWRIVDTARSPYNLSSGTMNELYPNSSSAESASAGIDILSNGFKIRQSGSGFNGSGVTYIYAAFAEAPFQFANAR